MTANNDNDAVPTPAELEIAADWADRQEGLSDVERAELNRWLKATPRHAAAFAAVRRTLLDTALIEAAARVRATPQTPRPRAWLGLAGFGQAGFGQAWRGPAGLGLLAAGLAALAVLGPLVWRQGGASAPAPVAAPTPIEFATAVGARADHALEDASVVHLNAASRLSVLYTPAAREVRLEQGDAIFDVAKNPRRPFNVHAGDAVVTAVGTSFEVEMVSDAVEVRVFEGAVRVRPLATSARVVRKGEWLRLVADRGAEEGRFSPATYQTWRADWLEADNTPLKYVVARLNRYSPRKIVIGDAGISDVGVTGRFQLDRTGDALSMISALLSVDTIQDDDEIRIAAKPTRAR